MKLSVRNAFFALFLTSLFSLHAQTTEWVVKPVYSEIQFMAPGLYKVERNGKVGVLDKGGRMVVNADNDLITDFYEGRALIGVRDERGTRLCGVLSEDGSVFYPERTFYILEEYPFYSEGFLTVRDGDGKYGFLNHKCEPAFEFTYNEVRPFSEGRAAIGECENFHWLTADGEMITFMLDNGGMLYGGTNYYDGVAYLWDEDLNMFQINSLGKISKANLGEGLEADYLYRPNSLSYKGLNVEYLQYDRQPDGIWQPTSRDGDWTYVSKSGKLLAPFQYEQVTAFSEGVAPAMSGGRWGLLGIVADNSSFSTKTSKREHVYQPGKSCECGFALSIPEKWSSAKLKVNLKDSDTGEYIDVTRGRDNTYVFTYRPDESNRKERKTFVVEVADNDVSIWQGEEIYDFVQRAKLIAQLRVNNVAANSNDRCLVTATLKNPSSIPITTTVSLTGGGSRASFQNTSRTVTVPPHGVASVTSHFYVSGRAEREGWCAVQTGDGSSSRLGGIQMRPKN